MGLFDKFPWVNTHDLNLDWIIQKMKEWGADAAQNVAKAETAATNAAANAAAAVVGVAERAEAAADRAETAKSSAETAQAGAETAKADAASAAKNSFKYSTSANNSKLAAQNSATAAAQSAEEAKTATKWPYDGVYNGYLYKRLDAVDQYTTTNMEFLTAPQENRELYRVSGRVPKRASFNDATTVDYHYEKIFKIPGSASGNLINFSSNYVGTSVDGLIIAEAEPVGMVVFLNSNNSFYKYLSLPVVSTNSGQFSVDSNGFSIADDLTVDMSYSLQNEGLSASNVTAYLYVRMKYTF